MTPQTTQEHRAAQAAFADAQEAERKRLVKMVQTARRDRKWDDDAYLAIKRTHGGEDSAGDMDIDQLQAVIAYAVECGFKVRHTRADGKPSRPLDPSKQAKLIRAVWLKMHQLGIVRHGDESALGSWLANHRDGRVVTDLALLSAAEMDASVNRVRAYFCREIRAGQLVCPSCGATFRPTDRRAWAWGQGQIKCDRHPAPVAYEWQRLARTKTDGKRRA